MSTTHQHQHGQLGYLQIPATDLAQSAAFYTAVFGWSVELEYGSFEAPGLIGQFTTELAPAGAGGPVLWISAKSLWPALVAVTEHGGRLLGSPQLDQGERWLIELADPAGNRIGLVTAASTGKAQTVLAVRDVEASSRWYCELLGLSSGHGGRAYERLLVGEELVLQLHARDVEHHHSIVGDEDSALGNGVLVWFGEVGDFDGVVDRAERLQAPVVRPPHRNPPEGEGNGPAHRQIWLSDPDGYTVVVASPDGEAWLVD